MQCAFDQGILFFIRNNEQNDNSFLKIPNKLNSYHYVRDFERIFRYFEILPVRYQKQIIGNFSNRVKNKCIMSTRLVLLSFYSKVTG